ncbi:Lanosterol synthase (Oxidosqualene--lanosterol cyclase) [Xylographa pallens]|nr:Lanosterol synthase (Oxidosqualene--lanosterol cyclase) [Xylographa pallens]
MARLDREKLKPVNSHVKTNGGARNLAIEKVRTAAVDAKTDLNRWRLLDEEGRQTWHYLESEDEIKEWPQSIADRHHLGLPLDLPTLPHPTTPLASARNAVDYFSNFQLPPGNWACEYGGPMFLLPGLVITWYVTETPIPQYIAIEIKRYLFARQHLKDGGWGLHIEGESSVFGTAMNYVVMRILGASEEDPRMIKARNTLHQLGGAVNGPHWSKFWLSVLGVMEWSAVNPVPPELWLLPDWVPIAPWRWWVHMRQVFLPVSHIYSKRYSYPLNSLTRQLREELYIQSYDSINFASHRNTISPRDNYHPKTFVLNSLNWLITNIWNPYLRSDAIAKRAEEWTYDLIRHEDENTDYANLGPVSAVMNLLVCYLHDGPDSYSVRRHRERMHDFLWMKNEGMLMNGTNGVQIWDASFLIQAAVEAGLAEDPKWRPMLTKTLEFLDNQQIRENCKEQDVCYRQRTKGAWAFSTKTQGYTLSDCTSEALKSVILLQDIPGYPKLVSEERIQDAIDTLLTMQNSSGGFASYEPTRGSEYLEWLNAAEVFGNIMVEYDYPECTTSVVTALSLFSKHDPEYRKVDISKTMKGALQYIRKAQYPDGSWYGSWGICFTYAGMFALESLSSVGETYANSPSVAKACGFLVSKQKEDGGWGESYKSCETGVYVQHEKSQVVQTCWALLGLMEADFPRRDVLERGIRLIMGRQKPEGGWEQEAIEGVFNKSWHVLRMDIESGHHANHGSMISYPNYKYIFPIKTLGMFAKKYGNLEIL